MIELISAVPGKLLATGLLAELQPVENRNWGFPRWAAAQSPASLLLQPDGWVEQSLIKGICMKRW